MKTSYTAGSEQSHGVFTEFIRLYQRIRRFRKEGTVDLLCEVRAAEQMMKRAIGKDIQNLKMLEIGPGQLPRQAAYFAQNNEVVGIDLDVVSNDLRIRDLRNMWAKNGLKRVAKTLGRKLIGFDRWYLDELSKQMGVTHLTCPILQQMDASKTDFPECSFDVVYSFNVFEHLPDPEAVLIESIRVVRPGGCVFVHLHLYTSDDGCHDLRAGLDDRGQLPWWPHLRPGSAEVVQTSAYINKYLLSNWHDLFQRMLPGAEIEHWKATGPEQHEQLRRARMECASLSKYSDLELLTRHVVVCWRKPTPH
jgi:SAM-dependent methyltransferase